MKHNLQISVSKQQLPDGIVTCKQMSLRDRKFKKIFGKMQNVMIIVPGDSVQDITISEVDTEGGQYVTG